MAESTPAALVFDHVKTADHRCLKIQSQKAVHTPYSVNLRQCYMGTLKCYRKATFFFVQCALFFPSIFSFFLFFWGNEILDFVTVELN